MTQDEIIRMAQEAGYQFVYLSDAPIGRSYQFLERFAALVAAHEREKYKAMDKELAELYEMAVNQAKTIKKYQDAVLAEREACAKVCEKMAPRTVCAAAIQARGNDAGS